MKLKHTVLIAVLLLMALPGTAQTAQWAVGPYVSVDRFNEKEFAGIPGLDLPMVVLKGCNMNVSVSVSYHVSGIEVQIVRTGRRRINFIRGRGCCAYGERIC